MSLNYEYLVCFNVLLLLGLCSYTFRTTAVQTEPNIESFIKPVYDIKPDSNRFAPVDQPSPSPSNTS